MRPSRILRRIRQRQYGDNMQNTRFRQCALAALATALGSAAGSAIAQSSVTIYGTVDAGLQYQNRSAAGGSI
ncbi:porin, partial [Acinetobacter baumannii]